MTARDEPETPETGEASPATTGTVTPHDRVLPGIAAPDIAALGASAFGAAVPDTNDDCTAMSLLLQADIDNELSAAEATRVATHMATCAACTAMQARLLLLSQRIRATLPRHTAPPALQETVRTRIAANPITAAASRFAVRQPGAASFGAGFAIAAALALFAILPRALTPAAIPNLAAAIVDSHVHALQPGHLIDIASSDRHTVKPWFDGKLPFAPPVRDFTAAGFPLAGGRLDYVGGHLAAALIYRRRNHLIDVFIWPGQTAPASGSRDGYAYQTWSQDGMVLWTVSDLNAEELGTLVTALKTP